MVTFFKNCLIVFLMMFCASCKSHSSNTERNLEKLRDIKANLGVFIARPMFFASREMAENFGSTFFSNELIHKNSLTLEVAEPSSMGSLLRRNAAYIGRDSGDNVRILKNDDSMLKFIITPAKFTGGIFNELAKDAVVRPEYFYSVGTLPEGEYFIQGIRCSGCGRAFGSSLQRVFKENEDKYYFYIKAGHINYIGDFYWAEPKLERYGFFMPTEYNLSCKVYDKSREAETFLKDFFQDIDLPYTKSILQYRK